MTSSTGGASPEEDAAGHSAARVLFCDESDFGFGWISPKPGWMARASHALATDGDVWLIDPVDFDGLDDRLRSLGDPTGVLQLFGRHHRNCASIAARLGVRHLVVPETVVDSPFETIPITGLPGRQETALWWAEKRTLIVAEAVGTAAYYRAHGQPLGILPSFESSAHQPHCSSSNPTTSSAATAPESTRVQPRHSAAASTEPERPSRILPRLIGTRRT